MKLNQPIIPKKQIKKGTGFLNFHTHINLPLSFPPLTLQNQGFPLSTGEWLPLNHPPLLLPLLLQFQILPTLQTLHLRVHRRSTHPGPRPVEPVRSKRRVLRLPEPDGSHRLAALRVAPPEIEGQVGIERFAAGPVERRGGFVLGLRLFLVGFGWGVIGAFGFGGDRRRWYEIVTLVEFGGGGGGEVAREERDGG